MGVKLEDLTRAGFVEVGGKLERQSNVGSIPAVNVGPAQAKPRKTRFQIDSAGAAAELEPTARDGALAALQIQKGLGRHFLVVIEAVRTRLLDDDNAAAKYHVDLLRYAGVIPDDCPGTTRIQVTQQKAQAGEAEEVRISVYEV